MISYQQVINNSIRILLPLLVLSGCVPPLPAELDYPLTDRMSTMEQVHGSEEYRSTKQFTAGNNAYIVGLQDGTFPPMGWHIPGEMGGFWSHPYKFMDGFHATVVWKGMRWSLDSAQQYANTALGNSWTYEITDKEGETYEIFRSQFIPDPARGVVVEYDLRALPQGAQLIFIPEPDIRPTWLGERTGMQDGDDLRAVSDVWQAKDALSGATVVIGHLSNSPKKATFSEDSIVGPRANVHQFYLAAGADAVEARTELARVKNWDLSWHQKGAKHHDYAQFSALSETSSKAVENTFRWLKHNALWLEMDGGDLGYGFVAGMEDYPWFFGCDSEFTVLGLNRIGRYDLSKSMLRLLRKASDRANGTGQIIHEMSTNGAVFNPGNMNETPQFVTACWDTYLWSGDREFLAEMYPAMVQSMRWLEKQDADGNGIADGYGMMEIHGMNGEMIDVASYSVQAWQALEKAAYAMDNDNTIAEWAGKSAARLAQFVNEHYWVERSGTYADVRGTPDQALALIRDAIERAQELEKPWAVEELRAVEVDALMDKIQGQRGWDAAHISAQHPYSIHHNWIVNTPMEVGFAPRDRALQALDRAREYSNEFGLFVTGIDRDERSGEDAAVEALRRKTFSYVGAVMTLPTGVAAVAENNYGRPDFALDYLERMARSWSYAHPGSMYEVSPDFGMMCQAWNIYSFAVPIVGQFFGLSPDPATRTLHIDPNLPASWTAPELRDVRVGEGEDAASFTVRISTGAAEGEREWVIQQRAERPWQVTVRLPNHAQVTVDGEVWNPDTVEDEVKLTGRHIHIRW